MDGARIIKRYGSRKLYDPRESRYVSLEEIGDWIRAGEEIRVLDNETAEDVTAWTLTQILSEDGRSGRSSLPSALLHDVIRLGGRAVHSGMESLRSGVDRLLQASLKRLGPVRTLREETSMLRSRLDELEAALAALESGQTTAPRSPEKPARRTPGRGNAPRRKRRRDAAPDEDESKDS